MIRMILYFDILDYVTPEFVQRLLIILTIAGLIFYIYIAWTFHRFVMRQRSLNESYIRKVSDQFYDQENNEIPDG
jgi:hypothetical protein